MGLNKLMDEKKLPEARVKAVTEKAATKEKKAKPEIVGRSKVKTYRMDNADLEGLKKIQEKLNEATYKKISETKVIRALIVLGNRTKPDKLVECLRELL
jgi:hypothetical protein